MFSGKIAEEVTINKILDEVRSNVNSIYYPITCLSKKDYKNIKRNSDLHIKDNGNTY